MSCPCDDRAFPGPPDIPAGLDRLPRQIATFAEFRRALLDGIDEQVALADWRARGGDDFGVMMLEWWAYVLDVLAFYSGEIATESYLRTARRDASLQRLVALIGYTPKPAIASTATLALFAETGQPVLVPAGTAFRSDAFGDEPPQVFETGTEALIDPTLNGWTLAAIPPTAFGAGPLLLALETAAARAGQTAVLAIGKTLHAARIAAVETVTRLDGADYAEVTLDPTPKIGPKTALAALRLRPMGLSAGMNTFAGSAAVARGKASVTLVLDALYPQVRAGAPAMLAESETGRLHAAEVTAVATSNQVVLPAANEFAADSLAPFTQVTLAGTGPGWIETADPSAMVLHFRPLDGGTVTGSGATTVGLDAFTGGAALDGTVEPLRQPTSGTLALWDAQEKGAILAGTVTDDGAGNATLTPLTGALAFEALRTPVAVHANIVTVTRGERVEEVLGTGNATPFQTFRLTRKPLTYLAATGAAGRTATLEVWVDGSRWREAPGFFATGPDDRVYTLRQTVDGEAEVTFGGLGTGQPLPSGATVTARYRHGAGAASPPAGAITQVARPVKGLTRALNPLAAFGGDDGDDAAAIRTVAPDSALSLGRVVSLIDFEAAARAYPGIVNAAARMDWVEREQRVAVLVWIVPAAADEADQVRAALEAHLAAIAAEGTPVAVALATADPVAISFEIDAAPDLDPAGVEAAAAAALAGALAVERVPIGAPLFRADMLAVLRAVEGVATVRALLADGLRAPVAIEPAEGHYPAATVIGA
ncbi:MAG: hypothetical protein AAFR52_08750 [Pseudomonadota bacterium]